MSEPQPDNVSMENHDLLKSRHTRSQTNYWTVDMNLGRLVLILTVFLLLTMALPVFGGYHGGVV